MLRHILLGLLLLCLTPLGVQGQGSTNGEGPARNGGLRERVAGLFVFGDCGEPLCLDVGGEHGLHFNPEAVQGQQNLIAFLTDAIGSSVGNIPISGASGGATFTFEGGLPVQTSVSAGPIFGERAQTLGRRRLLVGANAMYLRYRSLRGTPLENLTFTFTHDNVPPEVLGDPIAENDVLQVRTSLQLDLLVASFFATFGVTDWMDVGIAVPLVSTSMQGTSEAQFFPFSDERPHFFGTAEDPSLVSSTASEGSATGIGDLAVRAKVNLHRGRGGGFALLADARFPTGDEAELLGSGETTVRVAGVATTRFEGFSPHLNAGFLYRSGERSSNAVTATVGFDQLISSRATLAVELMSQWQVGGSTFELPAPVEIEVPFRRTIHPTNIADRRDDLVYGSVGGKFTLGRDVRVVTAALVPLTEGGLQPGIGWTLGLEYDF